eukprot:TRINITY_DN107129_c0_g1_i1.p1 TRINITY_DN107129_c0_g1~~TRINITY_DN107129_c0_g1_i1.p1  ORF type:complete len:310 (+),score=64.59 TRINITY_DN107129_c0_g1_i1:57-986(+)
MPRRNPAAERAAFRAAGWAALQGRLQQRLHEMTPLPPSSEKAWQLAGNCAGPGSWGDLLAWRLPEGSPSQLAEATQVLSPAWTSLAAWRRFKLPVHTHPGASSSLHFLGAAKAECAMPLRAFQDLPLLLGRTEISLIGPRAHVAACDAVETAEATMSIRVATSLYQDCSLEAPQLALALNAGLQSSRGRQWLPAMRRLLAQDTPTVITGYSSQDIVAGLACMLAQGLRPRLLFAGRNPFGSRLGATDPWGAAGFEDSPPDEEELKNIKKLAKKLARDGLRNIDAFTLEVEHPQEPLCNSYWMGFQGEKS